MDQFSHDLTVALEETSLLDRARVSRWGQQRRRTRSTGNLPCAPQPTEDSSSPTDIAHSTGLRPTTNNNDGLDTQNIHLPSDSDDKDDSVAPRLPCKALSTSLRLGTLESDSLNENFSPARFFKPSARRKRKLKRITIDYEMTNVVPAESFDNDSLNAKTATTTVGLETGISLIAPSLPPPMSSSSGTVRKRVLKPDPNSRSQFFFCGKRKRSNRDRYQEHDHSSSMPRHTTNLEEYRMRPRSFSSTSKPHSDRLLPLNKGLLSKIERISQQQKSLCTVGTVHTLLIKAGTTTSATSLVPKKDNETQLTLMTLAEVATQSTPSKSEDAELLMEAALLQTEQLQLQQQQKQLTDGNFRAQRKKRLSDDQQQQSGSQSVRHHHHHHRRRLLQFAVDQHSMDCEELNDFSSSSLSSSESDEGHTANDTDREGDDELTDWPGNESVCGGDSKYDCKRKLTKRSTLPQIKSDPESLNALLMTEDDTLMSPGIAITNACVSTNCMSTLEWPPVDSTTPVDLPYQPSEPITITAKTGFSTLFRPSGDIAPNDMTIPLKQIESEMSGETSNPFLASPPCQPNEVREIRAGCRRIKGERPGFSIKTSVNERLARFLQDPRQLQIRLPDVEIYEHDSLINLATLYSLQMSLDNGCAVLNKTSNTTQSVNIDQQSLQGRLLLSDFKRRCYDSKSGEMLRK